MIQRSPDETHLIFRWRVPARADGKRFVISGFLGYAPPPKAESGGTSPWLFAAIGGGLCSQPPRSEWGPAARGGGPPSSDGYGEPAGQAVPPPGFESVQWMRCWIVGLTTPPGRAAR